MMYEELLESTWTVKSPMIDSDRRAGPACVRDCAVIACVAVRVSTDHWICCCMSPLLLKLERRAAPRRPLPSALQATQEAKALVTESWLKGYMPPAKREALMANSATAPLVAKLEDAAVEAAAPSTLERYKAPWLAWQAFASEAEVSALPADPVVFGLYLYKVAETAKTYAAIKAVTSAASHHHRLANYPSPSTHDVVRVVKGHLHKAFATPEHLAKLRELGHVSRKLAFTPAHRQQMRSLFWAHEKVQMIQAATVAQVSIDGFLRPHEALGLLVGDVVDITAMTAGRYEAFLVFIERAKRDQVREGAWVPIACGPNTGGAWLRRWLRDYRPDAGPDDPVFAAAGRARGAQFPTGEAKALSYASYNAWFKKMVHEMGLEARFYAPHSGRHTGASIAANAGVSDRVFKKHGRWQSEKIKDQYVHENLAAIMAIPGVMQRAQEAELAEAAESP